MAYLAGQFNIHAYQEGRGEGRHGVVRCGYATATSCVLVVDGQHLPHEQEFITAAKASFEADQHLLERQPKRTNTILGRRNPSALGAPTSMSDKLLDYV